MQIEMRTDQCFWCIYYLNLFVRHTKVSITPNNFHSFHFFFFPRLKRQFDHLEQTQKIEINNEDRTIEEKKISSNLNEFKSEIIFISFNEFAEQHTLMNNQKSHYTNNFPFISILHHIFMNAHHILFIFRFFSTTFFMFCLFFNYR